MNLIKPKELDVIPLEAIRRELDLKKWKNVAESEINEIFEEPNIDEFESSLVNNINLKLEELGKSSRRDTILWDLYMFGKID